MNETNTFNEVNNEKMQDSTYKNQPKVSILKGATEVNGVLGSYSWGYCCIDGNAISIDGSNDTPPNLVQNKEPMKITSGTNIELYFETPPIIYEVKTWDENNDVTGTYSEIDTLIHKGKLSLKFLQHGNKVRQVILFY